MDLNYSYSLISFTVGTLSGFQSIAERYGKSRFIAVRTWPGLVYLAVRGTVSSGVFLALYASSLYWSSLIYQRPLLWAIVCGTGAEYLLRSKIFVLEKRNPGGRIEPLMLGPLDLLKWFQTFFLDMVEEKLTPLDLKLKIYQNRLTIDFLKQNMPAGTFGEFCQTVDTNLDGFESNLPEQAREIRQEIEKLRVKYAASENAATRDERFKLQLGHTIHKQLGEEGFLALAPKHEDRSERNI